MLESQQSLWQKQAVVLSLTHSSSKPEEYNTWCFDAHIFCRRYRPRSDEYDLKKMHHCAVLFDTCGNSSPFPPTSMEASAQDNCVQGERGWKK